MTERMMMRHLEVGPLMVNCYILGNPVSRKGVIIDPGEDYKDILDAANEMGLDIQGIIATHGHIDHNGAVAGLKQEYGEKVPYLLHEGDQFFIPDSKASAKRWGFNIEQVPEPDRFLTDDEYINLGDVLPESEEVAEGDSDDNFPTDDGTDDLEEIPPEKAGKLNNVNNNKKENKASKKCLELRIIHTPGHSPGGVSIHIASEGVLFSGDTLFQHSVGRTDFRKSSFEDLKASIRGRLYSLPDDTKVYPGHGPATTIGQEKEHNMVVPERDRAAWFRI